MNSFFQKHKLTILGATMGAIGGYIYWYFWGCLDGCTIRSVWWRMSLWGALMGGLLASMLSEYIAKSREKNS
ncbi:hypothetical protein [Owenweeksia hongkongensis]|uniref:hypothetical protein n=1 Tax=Owenweeksia hongkongensis TaxID=253245 RepID=UPI003A93AF25